MQTPEEISNRQDGEAQWRETERKAAAFDALMEALGGDDLRGDNGPRPVDWLSALLAELDGDQGQANWIRRSDDPQAAHTAFCESCRLARRLKEAVAAEAA